MNKKFYTSNMDDDILAKAALSVLGQGSAKSKNRGRGLMSGSQNFRDPTIQTLSDGSEVAIDTVPTSAINHESRTTNSYATESATQGIQGIEGIVKLTDPSATAISDKSNFGGGMVSEYNPSADTLRFETSVAGSIAANSAYTPGSQNSKEDFTPSLWTKF
jgi:hypothetical protein